MRFLCSCLCLLAIGIAVSGAVAKADGLDSYVSSLGRPTEISVLERDVHGPSRVSFQSQVWRSIPWRHELIVKAPAKLLRSDFMLVTLTGGRGGEAHHTGAQQLADALGVRAAVLTQVPNQPLYGGKTEDDLLSYTLNEYRQSGDPSWPLLFPMVSSVVKGIDVLQEVLSEPGLRVVLIGASKRGWTTYLSGGVDKRIVGIVPAVFEMVSMQKQIALARSRYGRDSEKIRPYTALGLTDALLEPRVSQLVKWLDPAAYAPRFTMPKLVLLGANDPYWVVDSVREYWDVLPEPKMLRILPNVGHGVLAEESAQQAIVSFVKVLLGNRPLPKVSWNFSSVAQRQAMVSGFSERPLTQCKIWRATSESSDFRKAVFEAAPCEVLPGGRSFKARVATCSKRNTAVFADLLTNSVNAGEEFSMSTESHVWLASSTVNGSAKHAEEEECRQTSYNPKFGSCGSENGASD